MKNSVKELTEGMQRLCAVANRIVNHGDNVSRIERDLLLDDLRRLYAVALRLECEDEEPLRHEMVDMRRETAVDEEMLSSTVMVVRAAMGDTEPEPKPEPKPEPEPESEPEPEPEPVLEMESLEDNGNALLFDEVIIEREPESEPAPESDSEAEKPAVGTQASLLDYLKQTPQTEPVERMTPSTLGEQLTPTVRTLGEKFDNKVSDLRTVININDKFSFMSELFHNNMKAYNDFILRLNAIDTRDEALVCVNEVSAQYRWDEASTAVQAFYKIFDKKF